MLKQMYRINPALEGFQQIYLYGNQAGFLEELSRHGIRIQGFLVDDGVCLCKDSAVIFCAIDAKLPELLKKKEVSSVFVHRFLYQEELLFLELLESAFAPQSLWLGMPELYERENVIFGVGEDGHKLFMETLNIGIHIAAFCDSNPKYHGMYLMNKPVLSLDELQCKHQNSNVIIGSQRYFEEIHQKLLNSGIRQIYKWE